MIQIENNILLFYQESNSIDLFIGLSQIPFNVKRGVEGREGRDYAKCHTNVTKPEYPAN